MTLKKKTTILIVDDEPANLQAIAEGLTGYQLPYEIIKAPNGIIAHKLTQKRIPDLIITDWDMPQMNGIELIETIKAEKSLKHIPIIMCTGVMTSSENLNMALRAGAADFIRKPIDKIELTARVNSMLCLSESYKKIRDQKEEIAIEKRKVEKLLIDSQLAFLRNQVSPHFLMNTLNNIHALIDINTDEAQSSIIILSKLMRHLLYESEGDLNPLGIEIDFIRNYVQLMQLRFRGKVDIKLDVQDKLPNSSIPPLLFTSLLENAFKHGIAINSASFININIHASGSKLFFEIKNGIPNNGKNIGSSGIGIENTRKRLELIYGSRCELIINNNSDTYCAKLCVPI